MNNQVEISKLSFFYSKEKLKVIKGLNLFIPLPENILILGDNGSGKSTFGKLVCGLLTPKEGSVLINSKEIHRCIPKDRIHQAYYINQLNQLQFVSNSLKKEISFVEKISGNTVDEKKMSHFFLPNDINTNPFELLVNEAWRFSLYLATIIDPVVLFIDEIPSGVNALNNHCLKTLLDERKEKGLVTFIAYQRNLTIPLDRVINL